MGHKASVLLKSLSRKRASFKKSAYICPINRAISARKIHYDPGTKCLTVPTKIYFGDDTDFTGWFRDDDIPETDISASKHASSKCY